MIHHIFTIYDQKAKAYLPPFYLPERGMAERTFSDCVNSNDHQFGAHPQDYTLFTIGLFDDSTAESTIYDAPVMLGNGVEYVIPHTNNADNLPLEAVS